MRLHSTIELCKKLTETESWWEDHLLRGFPAFAQQWLGWLQQFQDEELTTSLIPELLHDSELSQVGLTKVTFFSPSCVRRILDGELVRHRPGPPVAETQVSKESTNQTIEEKNEFVSQSQECLLSKFNRNLKMIVFFV